MGASSAGPSKWAKRTFGEEAAALAKGVPRRLNEAHLRAQATHETAGLKRRSPYGGTLAEAVREGLADEATMLGGMVREIRGYPYAVINEHALFPYKYAKEPLPLDRARLKPSPLRRRLFTSHGPVEHEGLFPVDDSLMTEEYEQLHEAFEELGRTTRLVSVLFTADVDNGIHQIHWG
jgi:hypothetical protein